MRIYRMMCCVKNEIDSTKAKVLEFGRSLNIAHFSLRVWICYVGARLIIHTRPFSSSPSLFCLMPNFLNWNSMFMSKSCLRFSSISWATLGILRSEVPNAREDRNVRDITARADDISCCKPCELPTATVQSFSVLMTRSFTRCEN